MGGFQFCLLMWCRRPQLKLFLTRQFEKFRFPEMLSGTVRRRCSTLASLVETRLMTQRRRRQLALRSCECRCWRDCPDLLDPEIFAKI